MNKYDAKSVMKAIEDYGWKIEWKFLEYPVGYCSSSNKHIHLVITDNLGYTHGEIVKYKNNIFDSIAFHINNKLYVVDSGCSIVSFLNKIVDSNAWKSYQYESPV